MPTQHDVPVRAGDQSRKLDTLGPDSGLGRERSAATAAHPTQERPLSRDGQRGFNMMQWPEEGCNIGVSARFYAERPLSDSRDKDLLIQDMALLRHEVESLEAGCGQNRRIDFSSALFAQAGLDIAAQHFDVEVGPEMEQQSLTAQAARPDASTRRQLIQGFSIGRDQDIPRVFPLWNHTQ